MMNRLFFSTLLIVGLTGLGLTAFSTPQPGTVPEPETQTAIFKVTGMTCGGCEVGVRMAVGKLGGVERVEASYEKGTVTVQYDAARLNPKEIKVAIEKLGYQAELEKEDVEYRQIIGYLAEE